eukprot:842906_1
MARINTFLQLYKLQRRGFRTLPNETEHILQVNGYTYPVSLTKSNTHQQERTPTVLLPAMGQPITEYSWLKKHLSQYNDVLTIAHTSTPHALMLENAAFVQKMKPSKLDFEMDIACIKNALDHCGITNADFVGVSFGGMITGIFAKEYPLLVNSMVLSSVGLYISDNCEQSIIVGLAHVDAGGDAKTAAKMSAERFSKDPLNRRLLTKHMTKLLKCNVYSRLYASCNRRILEYFHAQRYQNMNLETMAPHIKKLLICAKSDDIFTLDSSLDLAETMQNCRIQKVDGCHLWMLDKDKQDLFCHLVKST